MLVRLADPAEAEAIAATLRDAFVPFEPLYTPDGFAATTPGPAQIRARWSEGPVWVAERDGTIVGTVSAVPRAAELYVRSMAVQPRRRVAVRVPLSSVQPRRLPARSVCAASS